MGHRNTFDAPRPTDQSDGLVDEPELSLGLSMTDEAKVAKRKSVAPQPSPPQPQHIQDFEDWRNNIKPEEKVAIFGHFVPDPDCIGSMMGMQWLLSKEGIESECFCGGVVSHPQNVALINLLDPQMLPIEDFKKQNFKHYVVLDCIPDNDNACVGGVEPKEFGLVVDHHKVNPNNGFDGTYINLKNGSCCGTVYNLIKYSKHEFEVDNALDSKVVTALMVGIATDTDNLLADSCTEYEFDAYWQLFDFRDATALKEIVKFKRPKFWIDRKAEAASHASIGEDGVAVVGMGLLPERHYNLIADMADEMIQWASVETAICFAVVEGEYIVGSVRSINSSVNVNTLSSILGGKYGSGGGRDGKGSYRYSMQGLAIEDDEDEQTKAEMWSTINRKEIKRIFKMVKK